MKIALSDSFRSFFAKHRLIEFEQFLSQQEIEALLQSIPASLLQKASSKQDIWKQGKDLWKKDPLLLKIIQKSHIGEVASFLFKKRPIRLACTQVFSPAIGEDLPFTEAKTIQEISSITPLLGGVFLCLASSEAPAESSLLPDLTKQTKGHAIFFSPDYPLPLPDLFSLPTWKGLLICFAPQKIRYILQSLDIHTHSLKREGYVFGDQLKEKEAPYLYY